MARLRRPTHVAQVWTGTNSTLCYVTADNTETARLLVARRYGWANVDHVGMVRR